MNVLSRMLAMLVFVLAASAGFAEAAGNRVPARIGVGWGEVQEGHNRRLVKPDGSVEMMWANRERVPTSPVDYSLGVLRVETIEGEAIATLVNYACTRSCWGRRTCSTPPTSSASRTNNSPTSRRSGPWPRAATAPTPACSSRWARASCSWTVRFRRDRFQAVQGASKLSARPSRPLPKFEQGAQEKEKVENGRIIWHNAARLRPCKPPRRCSSVG